MSKVIDLLSKVGVYNDYDFAEAGTTAGEVYVMYCPWDGMGVGCSVTRICLKNGHTDPDGPWYNRGNKTFTGKRKVSLPEALEWATTRYGISEWKRTPFGSYMDAGFVKSRLYNLKKQAEAKA